MMAFWYGPVPREESARSRKARERAFCEARWEEAMDAYDDLLRVLAPLLAEHDRLDRVATEAFGRGGGLYGGGPASPAYQEADRAYVAYRCAPSFVTLRARQDELGSRVRRIESLWKSATSRRGRR